MAMHMGPQHPGASMSASVQVPASLVHQNEYIPVVHPAPHPSPLGVVGVVGVDPESVGRQTTNRLSTNHSADTALRLQIWREKAGKCSFLFFFQSRTDTTHVHVPQNACLPNKQ